jgi:hypothetical protein
VIMRTRVTPGDIVGNDGGLGLGVRAVERDPSRAAVFAVGLLLCVLCGVLCSCRVRVVTCVVSARQRVRGERERVAAIRRARWCGGARGSAVVGSLAGVCVCVSYA